jgi:hypothetical protein
MADRLYYILVVRIILRYHLASQKCLQWSFYCKVMEVINLCPSEKRGIL